MLNKESAVQVYDPPAKVVRWTGATKDDDCTTAENKK